MVAITKFEDLVIWQLSRFQTTYFDKLVETTLLTKDFEIRNQMNASSGSIMDCIAEGFERSGNKDSDIKLKTLPNNLKPQTSNFKHQIHLHFHAAEFLV